MMSAALHMIRVDLYTAMLQRNTVLQILLFTSLRVALCGGGSPQSLVFLSPFLPHSVHLQYISYILNPVVKLPIKICSGSYCVAVSMFANFPLFTY